MTTEAEPKKLSFKERIIKASEPFGIAMIEAAKKIEAGDVLLEQALELRKQQPLNHADEDFSYEAYRESIRNLLGLPKGEALDAALGYINLKSAKPDFQPTLEALNALIGDAVDAYKKMPFGALKENLMHLMVAGRFDTEEASVALTQALHKRDSSFAGLAGESRGGVSVPGR